MTFLIVKSRNRKPNWKEHNLWGFYREWAPGGVKTVPAQTEAMQVFTNQIEKAVSENIHYAFSLHLIICRGLNINIV